eukprot:PLAT6135.1.p1 GENE.PLAT6135.1~~PLAT6135.1.p1  ORF type:complete len:762 (+),score=225.69 PLAT6135.1:50-2335(+)
MGERKVRVVVRVRPLLPFEKGSSASLLEVDEEAAQCVLAPRGSRGKAHRFAFDAVLPQACSQRELFAAARLPDMCKAAVDGYHATVFAYGQTASGKTFSMEGYEYESTRRSKSGHVVQLPAARPKLRGVEPARLGVVPRAIVQLFRCIEEFEDEDAVFTVRVSFTQIYNEQVYDLLNATHLRGSGGSKRRVRREEFGKGLRMRWSASHGFHVENLFRCEVSTAKEALSHFHTGIRNKAVGSNFVNQASSRSHCLFTLEVERSDAAQVGQSVIGKLTLVDLAGSERVDASLMTKKGVAESVGINKSLFTLRKVITLLAEGGKAEHYVPFRDSKLTALLKNSLGGNSMTLMLACLSPSDMHYTENMSTLRYAARAGCITTRPVVHEDPQTRQIRKLKQQLKLLRKQLAGTEASSALLSGMLCAKCGGEVAAAEERTAESSDERSHKRASGIPRRAFDKRGDGSSSGSRSRATASSGGGGGGGGSGSRAVVRLKQDKLELIDLIKKMEAVRVELNHSLEAEVDTRAALQRDNRQLNLENQKLREQVEMMESLLRRQGEAEADKDLSVVIPGYGEVPPPLAPPASPRQMAMIMREMAELRRENEELQDALRAAPERALAKARADARDRVRERRLPKKPARQSPRKRSRGRTAASTARSTTSALHSMLRRSSSGGGSGSRTRAATAAAASTGEAMRLSSVGGQLPRTAAASLDMKHLRSMLSSASASVRPRSAEVAAVSGGSRDEQLATLKNLVRASTAIRTSRRE